ncbi:MAG: hypothetical protein N2652_05360 [Kiritimatiellae bacterium]|nr:hypothetical protein [Kiritimatiellia bacterium]
MDHRVANVITIFFRVGGRVRDAASTAGVLDADARCVSIRCASVFHLHRIRIPQVKRDLHKHRTWFDTP